MAARDDLLEAALVGHQEPGDLVVREAVGDLRRAPLHGRLVAHHLAVCDDLLGRDDVIRDAEDEARERILDIGRGDARDGDRHDRGEGLLGRTGGPCDREPLEVGATLAGDSFQLLDERRICLRQHDRRVERGTVEQVDAGHRRGQLGGQGGRGLLRGRGRRRGGLRRQLDLLDAGRLDAHGVLDQVGGWPALHDGVHDVHALHDAAEDRVRARRVERRLRLVVKDDEELAALRVRLRCSGHGHDAAAVLTHDLLVGDRVARATGTRALRVPALDDEAGLDAMEADAVVVAGLDEVQEVLGGDRRRFGEEADDDITQVGREAHAGAVTGRRLEGHRVGRSLRRRECRSGPRLCRSHRRRGGGSRVLRPDRRGHEDARESDGGGQGKPE